MTMTTRTNLSGKDEKIQKAYFRWLCDLVGIGEGQDHNSLEFAWGLHHVPFYATVPNDDNRAGDGKQLREAYADAHLTEDCPCLDGPASVFEMLIALAKRMDDYLTEPNRNRTQRWFWMMINNLGLNEYPDDDPDIDRKWKRNEAIINDFLERRYTRKGKGGLFPLKRACEDQRNVEIWYQLQAYLDENFT